MKDVKSFSETLYLFMEDFEYTDEELNEDIKDFFKSEYSLEYLEDNGKEFYLLKSNELNGIIKINITTIIENDKEHIFVIDSVKEVV